MFRTSNSSVFKEENREHAECMVVHGAQIDNGQMLNGDHGVQIHGGFVIETCVRAHDR